MIKKVFVLLFFCLTFSYAQSPEKFTYQSIIKNSTGYLLKNQDIGLKISVLFNSSNGIAVYSEEHTVESNDNGLVTLIIGEGTSSDVFSDIDWGGGEYFLKVEVDPEGGVNYIMEQTSQLLSVPYALYAGNSGSNLNLLGQDYINLTGQTLTINKVDLANDVDGVLPVVNGGTGSSTAPMVGVITAIDATASRLVLGLSTVANTGDYSDLSNTPTLPTDFISAASGGDFLGDITATNLSGTNTGDQTATEVTSSASGNIAAETVQAALAELDTEKLALAGGTMTGNIDMGDNDISNVSTFDSTGATSLATGGGVVNIASAGLATTIKGTLNVDEAVTLDTTLDVTGDTSVKGLTATGKVITASGTTGNTTINAMAGSINFASSATSLTVTNNLVDASSVIMLTIGSAPSTYRGMSVIPSSGQFAITLDASFGTETKVFFLVIN